ncbi:hypothetical protein Pyn_23171 [Prunus yedoensis var. nudiflora]|uniref:Uncharacterized protein n=1 Tax=Prunus yedoensis var. nudiflora TaxID=2094558 RepID=A0A314ULD4_PRUYE|nr:hypothetical protein Pyn_23171 [Prunus yedoensis var. nudiflora]
MDLMLEQRLQALLLLEIIPATIVIKFSQYKYATPFPFEKVLDEAVGPRHLTITLTSKWNPCIRSRTMLGLGRVPTQGFPLLVRAAVQATWSDHLTQAKTFSSFSTVYVAVDIVESLRVSYLYLTLHRDRDAIRD